MKTKEAGTPTKAARLATLLLAVLAMLATALTFTAAPAAAQDAGVGETTVVTIIEFQPVEFQPLQMLPVQIIPAQPCCVSSLVLLEEEADYLSAAIPFATAREQRSLNRALGFLERAMDDRYWENGDAVSSRPFNNIVSGIRSIERVTSRSADAELVDELDFITLQLFDIARGIATDEIDLAPADADTDRLERAEELILIGDELAENGNLSKGVHYFNAAWREANRA